MKCTATRGGIPGGWTWGKFLSHFVALVAAMACGDHISSAKLVDQKKWGDRCATGASDDDEYEIGRLPVCYRSFRVASVADGAVSTRVGFCRN